MILLFYKSEEAFTKEGYYATLLDLHRRGVITMEFTEHNKKILVNDTNEKLDRYETKVVSFLKHWGQNDIFDIDDVERRIKYRHYGMFEAMSFKREFDSIRHRANSLLKLIASNIP